MLKALKVVCNPVLPSSFCKEEWSVEWACVTAIAVIVPASPGKPVSHHTQYRKRQPMISCMLTYASNAHAQVGCTCLSVDSPLLRGRTFDVCIVDEAGQITLPAVLGALQLAHAFCLVPTGPRLSAALRIACKTQYCKVWYMQMVLWSARCRRATKF